MIDPDLPIPLYRQLGDVLRARLKDGEFPVGALFPSEPQLCELYGVSRITVIRALNELARAGLLVRRRGLGTFVLRTARPDEAGERPRVFAYVTPQIDSDWNTQILAGLESALASLRTLGVPLVFVDRDYEDVAADRVKADDEQAGYLATRHLLGSGHRRIAFLGWVSLPQTAQERRLVGYQRALDDAHVEPALFVLSAGGRDPLHESDDREALLNSLERRQISAVVCSTDFLAVTVERFLLSEGVGIPDDIAVVGISDERLAADRRDSADDGAHSRAPTGRGGGSVAHGAGWERPVRSKAGHRPCRAGHSRLLRRPIGFEAVGAAALRHAGPVVALCCLA